MDIQLPISASEIAKALGLSPQAVWKWSRVPADRVLDVSRATNWTVTPHEIRPDLYPNKRDGLPAKAMARAVAS